MLCKSINVVPKKLVGSLLDITVILRFPFIWQIRLYNLSEIYGAQDQKMEVSTSRWPSLLGVLAILFASVSLSASLAVMSIDLGNEYIKIAIVKPGVPMEIVLNEESQRKTAMIVAMRDGERLFGNAASTAATRFPKKAFSYMLDLIGKKIGDQQIDLYKKRFPYHSIVEDEDRGTIVFETTDDMRFTPEELLAMVLEKARIYAEAFADQTIKDCVITVPAYFNQAERRAVLQAAEMVGLSVLQLMSDNAAVALNYGVFRRKLFNTTMQYYMFYDMGASSTTVSIVGEYHVAKIKEGTRMDSNPQLIIKGVGFDKTLGGQEITIRLRDHLARTFNSQKKTKTDVFTSDRAMAKLLKEAERVKKVLSANSDHMAQIEGLLEEIDFRAKVTRQELEEMNKDLYQRITKPIEDAMKSSEITLPEITEIILMGGATRSPKVQEVLQQFLNGRELGKSLNTDEAAALGAVYQAAYLGKGFKVKTFGVREANIYPIVVEFDKQKVAEDGTETTRVVKRTLFGRMNPFPQKKVMTFNKHFKDFAVNVSYGDLEFLDAQDVKSFQDRLLTTVELEGVEAAYAKHGVGTDSKGVKAHFRMDESGILHLDHVEYVFEKEELETEEKSTWSKLGESISGLFGSKENPDETVETESGNITESQAEGKPEQSSSDKTKTNETGTDQPKPEPNQEKDKPNKEKKTETKKDTGSDEKQSEGENDEAAAEDSDEAPSDDKQEDDKTAEQKTDEEKPDSEKKEESADGKEEKSEEKKEEPPQPKQVTVKENITAQISVKDMQDFSDRRMLQMKKRLSEMTAKDKEKKLLEQSKNDLEAYLFDMADKITQEAYVECSTEEERESLSKKLAEASDWQYEQDDDAKKEIFIDKMDSLKKDTKDLEMRVAELKERPRALEALNSMLNHSEYFLKTIKNMSDTEDPVFTEVELTTLGKLINETYDWRKAMIKEQDETPGHEKPKMLVEDIAYKIGALDREVKYLINKAKNFKPKTKPKAANDTVPANETKDSENQNEEKIKTEESTTTEQTVDQELPEPPTEETPDTPSDQKIDEAEEFLQLDAAEKEEPENHDPQEL
ncbi:hypothetical protein ScPMuIL_002750 [Solemya velum]